MVLEAEKPTSVVQASGEEFCAGSSHGRRQKDKSGCEAVKPSRHTCSHTVNLVTEQSPQGRHFLMTLPYLIILPLRQQLIFKMGLGVGVHTRAAIPLAFRGGSCVWEPGFT